MYSLQDGKRVVQFSGRLLATSSSKRTDSTRWIEFSLYRTDTGTFVLHRLGLSTTFHNSTCDLVQKYGLKEIPNYELKDNATPCEDCFPEMSDPILYPEEERSWMLTTKNPEAVLKALYRPDNRGGQYLTKVAERLLEDASEEDSDIDAAYRVQYLI